MRVSYGPPGHKGVTHLVAVGADDDPACDPQNKQLMIASAALAGIGVLMKSSTTTGVGIGGVLALLAQRWLKTRRKVEVTTP